MLCTAPLNYNAIQALKKQAKEKQQLFHKNVELNNRRLDEQHNAKVRKEIESLGQRLNKKAELDVYATKLVYIKKSVQDVIRSKIKKLEQAKRNNTRTVTTDTYDDMEHSENDSDMNAETSMNDDEDDDDNSIVSDQDIGEMIVEEEQDDVSCLDKALDEDDEGEEAVDDNEDGDAEIDDEEMEGLEEEEDEDDDDEEENEDDEIEEDEEDEIINKRTLQPSQNLTVKKKKSTTNNSPSPKVIDRVKRIDNNPTKNVVPESIDLRARKAMWKDGVFMSSPHCCTQAEAYENLRSTMKGVKNDFMPHENIFSS